MIQREEKDSVGVVSFGEVEGELMKRVGEALTKRLPVEYKIMAPLPLPRLALDSSRNQYHASLLLDQLKQLDTPHQQVLAMVDADLFIPKRDFIFGKSDMVLGIAVFSVTRFRQKYYGLIPDKERFYGRVITEAVHEMGHLFGLYHCTDAYCVMFPSTSLVEADMRNPNFCPRCRKQLGQ